MKLPTLSKFNIPKLVAKKYLSLLEKIELPIDIEYIIKQSGLTIAEAEWDNNIDVSGVLDLKKNRILINRKDSYKRKRFTLAHEFGHYALHKDLYLKNESKYQYYRRTEPYTVEGQELEKEANVFASHILIPQEVLKDYYWISDNLLSDIFQVSSRAVEIAKNFIHKMPLE